MNVTNLPDSVTKILIVISAIIIYFSISASYKAHEINENYYRQYLNAYDSVKVAEINLDFFIKKMLDQSDEVSKKYSVPNFITDKDSIISFTQTFNVNKNEDIARDILNSTWNEYLKNRNNLDKLKVSLNRMSKEYDRDTESYSNSLGFYIFLIAISCLVFFVCIFELEKERKSKLSADYYLSREKGKLSTWCQSCGRVFSSVIIGGTNVDKSINYSFCKDCYSEGEFLKEDTEAYHEAISMASDPQIKIGNISRKAILRRIDNLDRWKKDNY